MTDAALSMTEIATAQIPTDADPRDRAEMEECQCHLRETLAGHGICPCGLGQLPPVPDDFHLTGRTPLIELQSFGMAFRAINSLVNAGVETVAEARLWLEHGQPVRQIGPVAIERLRAAIAAAEGWGT
jgi:hypothetical protein